MRAAGRLTLILAASCATPALACPPPAPGPPPAEAELRQWREDRAAQLGRSGFIATARIASIRHLGQGFEPTLITLKLDRPLRGASSLRRWQIRQLGTSCGPAPYYAMHRDAPKVGDRVLVLAGEKPRRGDPPSEVVHVDSEWAKTILRHAGLTDQVKARD